MRPHRPGAGGGTFQFGFGALPFECQITLPYWGSGVELMEVLDLARAGKIRAHVERFSLDRVSDAYEAIREGRLDGRAVICPHDESTRPPTPKLASPPCPKA
jgi:alcohol dehydrogenase, propanol-preferring